MTQSVWGCVTHAERGNDKSASRQAQTRPKDPGQSGSIAKNPTPNPHDRRPRCHRQGPIIGHPHGKLIHTEPLPGLSRDRSGQVSALFKKRLGFGRGPTERGNDHEAPNIQMAEAIQGGQVGPEAIGSPTKFAGIRCQLDLQTDLGLAIEFGGMAIDPFGQVEAVDRM